MINQGIRIYEQTGSPSIPATGSPSPSESISGRIQTQKTIRSTKPFMVIKVIRAGVPLLASKKAATAEAIQLASSYGLTLIGNVYTVGKRKDA